MFELTIKDKVYNFSFNMGFVREINEKMKIPVDGAPHEKQNVGLRNRIINLLDNDMETLVEVLYVANRKQDPRVTCDLLDYYIDEECNDVDELFKMVMDFLKKANATKRVAVELEEYAAKQRAKADQ